jgi:hypothetical protein
MPPAATLFSDPRGIFTCDSVEDFLPFIEPLKGFQWLHLSNHPNPRAVVKKPETQRLLEQSDILLEPRRCNDGCLLVFVHNDNSCGAQVQSVELVRSTR